MRGEGANFIMNSLKDLLVEKGMSDVLAKYAAYLIVAFVMIFLSIIIYFILKKIVLKLIVRFIKSNKFDWDDVLLEHGFLDRIIQLVPGIIFYNFAGFFDEWAEIIEVISSSYVLIIVALLIDSLLKSANDLYRRREISKSRPITGVLQIVKIAAYVIIGVLIVANIIDQDTVVLLGSLGAALAVVSFVFKDTILSFVAGIQLTANDMLQIGDWIAMPNFGADGDVIDITLTTVKVQNFDKTITMIPAYALVTNSFVNWRGMRSSGGRRIKRSLYIDINTISFCTDEMIEKFKKIHYLKDYINTKEAEIEEYNRENNINIEQRVNGRRLTNIGTFRAYMKNYLKNHPGINNNMIQMVRQLAPQESGVPLEIYVFTNTTVWVDYEEIQSDIFDHFLSVAEEFELKLFQNPTGNDMKQIVMK